MVLADRVDPSQTKSKSRHWLLAFFGALLVIPYALVQAILVGVRALRVAVGWNISTPTAYQIQRTFRGQALIAAWAVVGCSATSIRRPESAGNETAAGETELESCAGGRSSFLPFCRCARDAGLLTFETSRRAIADGCADRLPAVELAGLVCESAHELPEWFTTPLERAFDRPVEHTGTCWCNWAKMSDELVWPMYAASAYESPSAAAIRHETFVACVHAQHPIDLSAALRTLQPNP
jgi:hypothetical protein